MGLGCFHDDPRLLRRGAYYVERNRLFVLAKNFPAAMLAAAPWVSLARYGWHLRLMLRGRGTAARFRMEGGAAWRMPVSA